MHLRRSILALSAVVERASSNLSIVSCIALVALMCVTFFGVVMRYLFDTPVLGVNEITQLLSVTLVMMAMPDATASESHVRVDVLDKAIGHIGRFIGNIVSRVLACLVLGVLAYRSWKKLWDAAEYGDATNMLEIPLWPFYGLIVLGSVLYIVVLCIQLARVLVKPIKTHE